MHLAAEPAGASGYGKDRRPAAEMPVSGASSAHAGALGHPRGRPLPI